MQCLLVSLFLHLISYSYSADLVRVRLFEKYQGFTITGAVAIANGEKILSGSKLNIEPEDSSYFWTLTNAQETYTGHVDLLANLNISGDHLMYNELKLPKSLKIVPVLQDTGKFSRFIVVALLELEQYLAGVLPSEMPLKWPIEALKAQAITARTYTLKQIENRRFENFDLDSTVRDQLFAYDLDLSDERKKNLNLALEQTRGQILSNGRGEPIMVNYHADCGGKTELPRNVWNYGKYGVAVSDSSCALRPDNEWSYSISLERLSQKLRAELGVSGFVKLASLKTLGETEGGRVSGLRLIFSNGSKYELFATRLREILGHSSFKSTRFSIKQIDQVVKFDGRGFGHGVGMCQWGAKDLAKAGKTYREILAHYFPGEKITTLKN